ncbi:hypothetical protein [Alteromonas macleodii]|uniref:Uncharacterized protein n=1 Tax=Alteromonas macleodii TaxID=28108 RepID=A0AB36FM96_ALTMA|nr:hypothetical protein [Alteromonas macleodii]OES24187.1 hypothetical protein BFV93_4787 [Alteromonas macleodii]OES24820.1 hypothetical protein BFV95_4579 [Alteromonas macleodii]OES25098.1 hypothetical protein BFV94_4569 [Alteromonas macleodii]OES39141.1 hypothetical protein BFV96_4289 [Alteromonas macleodii]
MPQPTVKFVDRSGNPVEFSLFNDHQARETSPSDASFTPPQTAEKQEDSHEER